MEATLNPITEIRGRKHRTTEDYLLISQLKVDLTYHRAYDEAIARKILRQGDGHYVEEVGRYILVSRRQEGDYIIAGLHRTRAAGMDGHDFIPAVIVHGLTVPEEAELARIEATRRKESVRDEFRQEYVAGFPEARAIVRIAERNGISVYMGPHNAGGHRTSIDAIGTLRSIYRRDDGFTLNRVMSVQRASWRRVSPDAKLLRGMADMLLDGYHLKVGISDDLLIKALTRTGERRIHELARDRKPIDKPLRVGYFRAITEEYSRGRRSNRLPTPWK